MAKKGKPLYVKSVVKELVGDFRISADFWDALNERIQWKIKRALERAKANGRKTVRGADL
jgi:histone H3/H4